MGVLLTICTHFIFHLLFNAAYVVYFVVCVIKSTSINHSPLHNPHPDLVPDRLSPGFIIFKTW